MPNPIPPSTATSGPSPATWGLRSLDVWLFQWMRAGHAARARWLSAAKLVARWSAYPMLVLMGVLATLATSGLWQLAQCIAVAGLVQLACKKLAARLGSPRPFVLGLSPNHLNHGSRSGFPSTHAAVMSTVVGFMAVAMPVWPLIAAMAAVALCTCWARIYAGAHFPSDVLAGLAGGGALGALAALQLA